MSKAKEVLKMADIIEAEGFTAGDNVKFKAGHALAGTFGKVAAVNADGSIGVMVGKSLMPPVSPSELELVDLGAQNKVGGQAAVGAPADLKPGAEVQPGAAPSA